jgi:hypothetical protein
MIAARVGQGDAGIGVLDEQPSEGQAFEFRPVVCDLNEGLAMLAAEPVAG